MSEESLPLLNVFEVELDGATHHLLCLIDPVLAGARGIDGRAVIGDFTPAPDGGFDPGTLRVNPVFIEGFQQFMNEEAARAPELAQGSRDHPDSRLYVIDPRLAREFQDDPPVGEIVGHFVVDEDGQIVPGSFRYNPGHLWFSPETGSSGILANRRFYDWLHPQP
jgi:hypothetical protein